MKVAELAKSNKRYKPELSLDAKDLPEIKNWSVGKKYTFEVTGEMVSVTKTDGDEFEDDGTRARFKVLKVRDCSDES